MSKNLNDPITMFVDEETERILGELQNAVQIGIEDILKKFKFAKQENLEDLDESIRAAIKAMDLSGDKRSELIRSYVERESNAVMNKLVETQANIKAMNDKLAHLQNAYENRLADLINRQEEQSKEMKRFLEEQELLQSVPGFWMLLFGKRKALEKARKSR